MFVPLLEVPGPPDETSLVVAVRGNRVLLFDREPDEPGIFLGTLAGRHCWAVDADTEGELIGLVGEVEEFTDLRMLWGSVDESTWYLAGARCNWSSGGGRTGSAVAAGTETVEAPGERAASARRAGCWRTRAWRRR